MVEKSARLSRRDLLTPFKNAARAMTEGKTNDEGPQMPRRVFNTGVAILTTAGVGNLLAERRATADEYGEFKRIDPEQALKVINKKRDEFLANLPGDTKFDPYRSESRKAGYKALDEILVKSEFFNPRPELGETKEAVALRQKLLSEQHQWDTLTASDNTANKFLDLLRLTVNPSSTEYEGPKTLIIGRDVVQPDERVYFSPEERQLAIEAPLKLASSILVALLWRDYRPQDELLISKDEAVNALRLAKESYDTAIKEGKTSPTELKSMELAFIDKYIAKPIDSRKLKLALKR